MQDLTETFSRLSGASLVNIINLKNLIKKIDVRLEMCISELMNISDSWCEPKLWKCREQTILRYAKVRMFLQLENGST